MTPVLATGTPALWYLTRGTGAVTLVPLTPSVVLGIVEVQRVSRRARPALHGRLAAPHRLAARARAARRSTC